MTSFCRITPRCPSHDPFLIYPDYIRDMETFIMSINIRYGHFVKVIGIILIFSLTMSIYYAIIRGFVPIPLIFRRIYHFIVLPKDLFNPIIEESFNFCKEGYSQTFSIRPKYFDTYCIGYTSFTQPIPNSYSFDGEVQADFFWENVLILSKKSEPSYRVLDNNDINKYVKLCFIDFNVPIYNKYIENITVRLTVLKASVNLLPYQDKVKMAIWVNSEK
jgi:hypothetical protein